MRFTAMAALVLTLLASGCASKKGIVGTWRATLPGIANQTATMTITYKPDGTAEETIASPGRTARIEMSYKAESGSLVQSLRSASINGRSVQPPQQTTTLNYKLDGDNLTLSQPGTSSNMVMTRVRPSS